MSQRYFPLRAVGYACNPFRALSVDEEAVLAVLPEVVTAAFDSSGVHLQILGEQGRGKSATLLGLAARAESAGRRVAYTYVPEGTDRFQTDLAELDLFVLDEAQRLSRRERGRLLDAASAGDAPPPNRLTLPRWPQPPDPLPRTRARGSRGDARGDGPRLILSSHADLAADFARRGLTLRTVRLESLGAEHTRAVIERRLAHFALADRPRATLTPDAYAWLAATFGDDLRTILGLLYEAFQQVREPLALNAERLSLARHRL